VKEGWYMPPDPELISETRDWLAKSRDDLRSALWLSEANPPLLAQLLFHCQQAAEKALKAFLAWHNSPFHKTHSIEAIGEQCLQSDATLKQVVEQALPLTQYAWRFRYPGEAQEPSRGEATRAITAARAVYDAALARLPEEVRP
jgi:HEPN domain-containing protein